MELCDGNLKDFIDQNKGKKIPEKDILYIISQICSALTYIHDKGIVHRDIKPENILFKEEDGRIIWKITDFGTSVKKGSQQTSLSVRARKSIQYASIEHLNEEEPQPAYDVWSAGIVLY